MHRMKTWTDLEHSYEMERGNEKYLLTIEKSGPGDFGGEFYPTFKEEIVPVLCRRFQNVEEGGGLGGISQLIW